VRVGAYEGLRVGEAVADVRRLGLRPAVERREGAEPEMHGRVASQVPAAGSDVQLGSAVSLFIAVPAVSASESGSSSFDAEAAEPLPVESPVELAQEPAAGGDFDVEDWWVGDGSYADDTVEIHELAPPEETGELWEPDTDESDGYDEDSVVETDEFEQVWDGEPGARRTQRWTIADEWEAGPLMVWWRSLSRPVRWIGAVLAVALAGLAFVLVAGGTHRAMHRTVAARRPVVRSTTRDVSPAPTRQRAVAPIRRSAPAAPRTAKRRGVSAGSRRAPRRRVGRSVRVPVVVTPASVPPPPPPASAPVPAPAAREAPVSSAAREGAAAEREFGLP